MPDTNSSDLKTLIGKAQDHFKRWSVVKPLDRWSQLERELKQYWAYCIYEHEYKQIVIQSIKYRYKHAWKDIDKFVQPIENPLKKTANLKSQTYARPPVRRTENKQLRTLIHKGSARVNKSMLWASKLLNATGNVLIWPVIGLQKGLPIVLDVLVIPAHKCYLEWCYEDSKYNIVAEYDGTYLVSYWTGESVDRERDIFHVKSDMVTPVRLWADYGEPIWCTLDQVDHTIPRSIGPIADLIVGTLEIGIMESFATKINYLKSFKQPVQNGEYSVTADQMIAGAEQLWSADVSLIDLADKNDFYEQLIQNKSIALMGQHGVSKLAATGDYQNEQSWISVSQELLQHWESQTQTWLSVENDLWESVCKMDVVGIDPEEESSVVKVKFLPPYPTMQDPQKSWELHREKVKHGCSTTVEYLMAENPWLEDEEQATKLYESNLHQYAKEIGMKRALNIGDDGSVGLSAVENGALGPIVKAVANGKLGASGPSMDGREVESELINSRD